jgi:hypothetical protein
MKIAIQGHPTRGKEVIQILESLGGRNINGWHGNGDIQDGFFIDNDGIIRFSNLPEGYKLYTLEEFEKEFPFKIGDEVTVAGLPDFPKIITKMEWDCDEILYSFEGLNDTWFGVKALKKFKMKEKRNITLSLEKAKEWYKKGGELKEIALQAYSEEELTKVNLPKTWKEFCENYPVKKGECWLEECDQIRCTTYSNQIRNFRNWITSKQSAEAHLAMIQLEQLRDCYRGLFITITGMPVWNINIYDGKPRIFQAVWGKNHCFLSFQSKEVAEEYLKNFKPLIEKAGDLI